MKEGELEDIFVQTGFSDFKWIDPKNIVLAQWVRMKCIYGCPSYGAISTCPPNVPSVQDCERFVKEYSRCAVFHFEKKMDHPEDRHEWTRDVNQKLYELELFLFKSGYVKVFLLPMDTCELCESCTPAREDCRHMEQARPTPDALGIDVYSTVRTLAFPIRVLSHYDQTMNRYAFMLIE